MRFLCNVQAIRLFAFSAAYIIIATSIGGCKTIEAPSDRKLISDRKYKESAFVTDKTPRAKGRRHYYWYKSQEIHHSQNDYAGELLDGPYVKYYYSNQLAERGNFNNGLKIGKWTSWHENGQVAQVSKWKKGLQTGKYIARDSLGQIVAYGSYKKGRRDGSWIYPIKGDTLYFIKGEELVIDSTITGAMEKPPFFKRIFNKKYRKTNQIIKKRNDTLNRGFFKRIFGKKNKTPKADDVEDGQKQDTVKTGFFGRIFKKKPIAKEQVEPKPLSQKEREELVRSKQAQKKAITNSNKSQADLKDSKKPQEAAEKEQRPGFFQRLFGKKASNEEKADKEK